jgi:hypothetical protein
MGSDYVTKHREVNLLYPSDTKCYRTNLDTKVSVVSNDIPSVYKPFTLFETIKTRGNPGWNRRPGSSEPETRPSFYPNSDRGGNCDHMKFQSERTYHPAIGYSVNYNTVDTMPIFTSLRAAKGLDTREIGEYAFQHHLPIASDTELNVLGASLSSRLSPLRPHASLFQTLVELKREGLPSLKSAVLSRHGFFGRARGVGDDWLNFSFGLKPLWNDLMSLAQVLIDCESLVTQFQRDSGRQVRRHSERRPVELSRTSVASNSLGFPTPGASSFIDGTGKLVTSELSTRETWFSGAFKYSLPAGDSLLAQLSSLNMESRYLLGLSFDPKSIWAVLGWSWLVDWFVNVGPVLENFTQTYMDKSVMAYGYIMCVDQCIEEQSYTARMRGANGGLYIVAPYSKITYRNFKRRQATPYGFGLSWTGFSPFQLSILASLGISKGRP